jgi:hypothetical protein
MNRGYLKDTVIYIERKQYIAAMAKLKGNALIEGFSGRLDNIILKHYRYGTVISTRPDMSKVKRTREQKQRSSRFAEAVAYARGVVADANLKKAYARKASKTGRTIYHLALSDYMNDATKTPKDIAPTKPAVKKRIRK